MAVAIVAAGFAVFNRASLGAGPVAGIANKAGLSIAQEKQLPGKSPVPAPVLRDENREVSLIAVGDIMMSRTVAKKIKAKKDINYPFLKIKDYLKSADLVFANLEAPITAGPDVPTGSMVFHNDPGAEKALAAANISIVSLANNHTPNYGQRGLLDTFKYLKAAGIKYAGAGKDEAEAFAPAVFEARGLKFALLAYNDSDVVPDSYGASSKRAGTALMNLAKMRQAVKAVRPKVDFVIVSMHSGKEYTETLTKSQTDFAHAAIEAGAELVIGHHPHVVQRVEKYKDKYILYSLGNFVFDQMWSEDTKRGMTAKIIFKKTGVSKIEFLPVKIEDYAQPRPLTGQEAEAVGKRLRLTDDKNVSLVK